jgi:hypothetical protein
MAKAMYTFSNFPMDKKDLVEQALRKAGGEPFEHQDFPGEICFYSAKTRQELQLVWMNVGKLSQAPDLKLRGPIPANN